MKKGIDASVFQGNVDWEAVKASGVEFVMLRAGYGQGNIDKKFREYAAACFNLGIPIGIYWFSYAYTVEMARAEARYCIEAIRPYKITYPVAFDFEYDSTKYAADKGVEITKQLASDMAVAFCQEIASAGYKPMVYANPDYLKRYFDERVAALPLWVASWPSTVNFDNPPSGAMIWQYSSKGSVPGISVNVDMDVCYADYESETAEPNGSGDNPSAWAKPACEWAKTNGIFNGDGKGNYDWQEPVTREQLAQVLYNQAHKG